MTNFAGPEPVITQCIRRNRYPKDMSTQRRHRRHSNHSGFSDLAESRSNGFEAHKGSVLSTRSGTAKAVGAVAAAAILAGSLVACGDSGSNGSSANQAASTAASTASSNADKTTTASANPSDSTSGNKNTDSPSPTLGSPARPSDKDQNGSNSNNAGNAPRNPGSSSRNDNTSVSFCTTRDLKVTSDQPSGAAGSLNLDIVFANTSKSTCKMRGFPGVSMVTGGDGTQLGEPAQRELGQEVETITLKPGQTAYSSVRITRTGPMDPSTCKPRKGDGLRIYPPEDTKAAFVRLDNVRGCEGSATYMTVQPVRG